MCTLIHQSPSLLTTTCICLKLSRHWLRLVVKMCVYEKLSYHKYLKKKCEFLSHSQHTHSQSHLLSIIFIILFSVASLSHCCLFLYSRDYMKSYLGQIDNEFMVFVGQREGDGLLYNILILYIKPISVLLTMRCHLDLSHFLLILAIMKWCCCWWLNMSWHSKKERKIIITQQIIQFSPL